MLVVAIIRLRLLSVPLERDEGEYAYMAHRLLAGSSPFQDAVSMKLPGTSMAYAVTAALFGETAAGIHAGLLLVSLTSMLLLFLALRRGFSAQVGVVTAGVFGLMGASAGVLGFAAHATHFVILFVAVGLFALVRYRDAPGPSWAIGAGLSLGLSFVMKQQAGAFAVFGAFAICAGLRHRDRVTTRAVLRDVGFYCAGVAVPYGLIVVWVLAGGNLSRFWFYTVEYAGNYASRATLAQAPQLFSASFGPLYQEFTVVFWLGLAGLGALFFCQYTAWQRGIVIAFALCSCAAVVPGYYFREHYFVAVLPALGLCCALALDAVCQRIGRMHPAPAWRLVPLLALVPVGVYALGTHWDYYWRLSPEQISRTIYGLNPFPEAEVIGEYVRLHSDASDTLAVLGSEPEFYVHADRRSASRHIYMYGMTEPQPYNLEMQEEAISEIEAARPKFIVFCRVSASWLLQPHSPRRILDWSDAYIHQFYDLIGVADPSRNGTRYYWGADLQRFDGQSHSAVLVYRRKPQ